MLVKLYWSHAYIGCNLVTHEILYFFFVPLHPIINTKLIDIKTSWNFFSLKFSSVGQTQSKKRYMAVVMLAGCVFLDSYQQETILEVLT